MRLLTATGIVLLTVGLVLLVAGVLYLALGVELLSDIPVGIALWLLALASISFGLGRITTRRVFDVGFTVAIIIVGTSAPVAWTLSTPQAIGCLGPCGEYFPSLNIDGSIAMPQGSPNGTINVQVVNSGVNNTAIVGLTVANMGPDYHGPLPNNISSVAMVYHANLVSSTNVLPRGATATASIGVSDVVRGATYTIFVSFAYASGYDGGASYDVPVQQVQYNSTSTIVLSLADGSTICPDSLSGNGVASWSGDTCTISPGPLSPSLCIAAESGRCATDPAAKLVVNPGVVLEIAGGADVAVYSTMDNFGTINATAGSAVLTDYGVINNYGTIDVGQIDVLAFSGSSGIMNNLNGTIINTYFLNDFGLIVNDGAIINSGHISECTRIDSRIVCGMIDGTGILECLDSCTIQTIASETQPSTNTTSAAS
jgi:hypothetical protein